MSLRFKTFILFLVLILSITPAFGVLSEYEATSAASKYQKSDEYAIAHGPYTYMNHPYYYIEYTNVNRNQTGTVILDGITGRPAEIETAKKIAYTHYILGNVTAEDVTGSLQDTADYKRLAKDFKEMTDEIDDLNLTTSPYLNATEKAEIAELRRITAETERILSSMIVDFETFLLIEKECLNGTISYENAVKYMDAANNFSKTSEELIEVFKDMDILLGEESDGSDIPELELAIDEINRIEQNAQKSTDWDISSMESRTQTIPGFGILFAVAAILIGGVLYKRK